MDAKTMQDSALAALTKLVEAEEKRLGIVRVPAPRDWVSCQWCGGGSELMGSVGCMACSNARRAKKKELDEEYKRQFPDGPKPIFTTRLDSPEAIEEARKVIGREAIEKAFEPGGGGVEEIKANAKRAMESR